MVGATLTSWRGALPFPSPTRATPINLQGHHGWSVCTMMHGAVTRTEDPLLVALYHLVTAIRTVLATVRGGRDGVTQGILWFRFVQGLLT